MPKRRPVQRTPQTFHIELRFPGLDAVPAFIVANVIEQLDNTLYRVERDEVDELVDELKHDIPGTVFNSIRYDLGLVERSVRPLAITDARSGSLVIGAVAGALAFWLLESTLGETFKEAWKRTPLHERLVRLLSSRLRPKVEKFADQARKIHPPIEGATVSSEVQTRGDTILVAVVVDVRDAVIVVPSASQLLK